MTQHKPTQERKAFKDWFDRSAAKRLAEQVGSSSRQFDQEKFIQSAGRRLGTLEFNARVKQFADALASCLPSSVPKALDILTRSLPDPLPDCESVTDGWLQWPIGQFIADHGVDHFEPSMAAMTELTKRFSSEFAVRPFVQKYPDQTFKRLQSLTPDQNPHVRRWCSEGVRPRLPWGKKLASLIDDPSPIYPILEALKDDPEVYVRRSVANNLNDIAKDHSAAVVTRCRKWSRKQHPHRDWTIRHGLRTLIKEGNPEALAVIGFKRPTKIEAQLTLKPRRIRIGNSIVLELSLTNCSSRMQPLIIDYVVHFVRKSQQSTPKVFKWTTIDLAAGDTVKLSKKHAMKITTVRQLYPGIHQVEIQINGLRCDEASFRLIA